MCPYRERKFLFLFTILEMRKVPFPSFSSNYPFFIIKQAFCGCVCHCIQLWVCICIIKNKNFSFRLSISLACHSNKRKRKEESSIFRRKFHYGWCEWQKKFLFCWCCTQFIYLYHLMNRFFSSILLCDFIFLTGDAKLIKYLSVHFESLSLASAHLSPVVQSRWKMQKV